MKNVCSSHSLTEKQTLGKTRQGKKKPMPTNSDKEPSIYKQASKPKTGNPQCKLQRTIQHVNHASPDPRAASKQHEPKHIHKAQTTPPPLSPAFGALGRLLVEVEEPVPALGEEGKLGLEAAVHVALGGDHLDLRPCSHGLGAPLSTRSAHGNVLQYVQDYRALG